MPEPSLHDGSRHHGSRTCVAENRVNNTERIILAQDITCQEAAWTESLVSALSLFAHLHPGNSCRVHCLGRYSGFVTFTCNGLSGFGLVFTMQDYASPCRGDVRSRARCGGCRACQHRQVPVGGCMVNHYRLRQPQVREKRSRL